MRVIDCEQGSAQWLDARRGKITASRIADVLAMLKKGGESAKRYNYRIELLAERLSGRAADHFVSRPMERGTEVEPLARASYEVETGSMVDQVGFVLHPTLDCSGSSPDGLIGLDGGLEIKCPETTTHLEWMLAGVVPEEHQPQMLWNMHCCERSWWDFISFDSRMPDGLDKFIVRMERDDKRIAEIEAEVIRFNDELEALADELRTRIKPAAPIPTLDGTSPLEMSDAEFEAVFGGPLIP